MSSFTKLIIQPISQQFYLNLFCLSRMPGMIQELVNLEMDI
ncbi:MAG: hypothetical protein AAGC93_17410 [Cyanobacteria bacterium P01_F01_bin.53]